MTKTFKRYTSRQNTTRKTKKTKKLTFEQRVHMSAERGRKKGIADGLPLGRFVCKDLNIKMPSKSKLSVIGIKKNSSVHIGYHFNNSRKLLFRDIFYKTVHEGGYTWNGKFELFALWLLNNREHKDKPYQTASQEKPNVIKSKTPKKTFSMETFWSDMFTKKRINALKQNPNNQTKIYGNVTKKDNTIDLQNIYGYISNAHNTITFIYPRYIEPSKTKELRDDLFKSGYDTNIVELYWQGPITHDIKLWRSQQV